MLETNITAWRRAICGDLTAAFDFATPNSARVPLPDTSAYEPPDRERHPDYVPLPPTHQGLPSQERGLRPARALPYELQASGTADITRGVFRIDFANTGRAGACFHVRSGNTSDGPPMDGANIEIRREVGDENIFIFGLTAGEVAAMGPRHDPWQHYRQDDELRRALDMIRDGAFSRGDRTLFAPVIHSLLEGGDRYLLLADYASYVECQGRVARTYLDPAAWTRKAILNTANMGLFSSDRTIRQYADEIWRVVPVPV